jgi:hypothetical protein
VAFSGVQMKILFTDITLASTMIDVDCLFNFPSNLYSNTQFLDKTYRITLVVP